MMDYKNVFSELSAMYDRLESIIDVLNDVTQTALENKQKVVVKYCGDEIEIFSFHVVNWAFYFGTVDGGKVVEVFSIEDIIIGEAVE